MRAQKLRTWNKHLFFQCWYDEDFLLLSPIFDSNCTTGLELFCHPLPKRDVFRKRMPFIEYLNLR